MAAALPDRYGASDTSGHVVTNNFLVSIGIIVGACGVAVMGSSIVVKTGAFYDFANYALEMLEQTQFVVYVGYGSLVLGFLGILTGFIVALSGLFVSSCPKLIYVALFCLLASGAGNIAAGAIIQQGVTQLDNAIYNPGPTPAPSAAFQATFTQRVVHFQLAMFNACCASKGSTYSRETFDGITGITESIDTDGYVKWCQRLHVSNANAINSANSPRSCFKDIDTYVRFNYTVSQNSQLICNTLTNAEVNIAGKKVPGTNIDVSGFTSGDTSIPVVGPFASPTFGCGIGYAKAFQAAMIIWAENLIQPVGTAFIACGAIYIVLFLVTIVTFYSCSKQKESAEERYARYLEEINSSSAANSNKQVAEAFEQANPNRMSVQNRLSVNQPMAPVGGSNRNSVQSHATHGSHSSYYGQQQTQSQEINFNVDDKI